jgi:hypothetical protein
VTHLKSYVLIVLCLPLAQALFAAGLNTPGIPNFHKVDDDLLPDAGSLSRRRAPT